MVWITFRVKNKEIRTTPTSTDSLVDFEQVDVCWYLIKRLLNDIWSILKMLYIKGCPSPSNFYWHSVLNYNTFLIYVKGCPCPSNFYWHSALNYNPFLNKNAGDTFTYYIFKNFNQSWNKVVQLETSKTKKGKSKTTIFFPFHLKFVKMKNFFLPF